MKRISITAIALLLSASHWVIAAPKTKKAKQTLIKDKTKQVASSVIKTQLDEMLKNLKTAGCLNKEPKAQEILQKAETEIKNEADLEKFFTKPELGQTMSCLSEYMSRQPQTTKK